MKKLLFVLLSLCLVYSAYAQAPKSQRTVLVEEFTNASCSPCASQNPAFNTLLNANLTKAVSIKYQWYFPGYDPFNEQNPTEANGRMSYYQQNAVPTGVVDGTVHSPVSTVTQAQIDGDYSVSSPFTLAVTHSLSQNLDSIHIEVTITATEAYTASGAFKCQIALLETEVHFATAPGANGEKDFFNIMRKMYPDHNGTTLPGSWTVGQSQTVTIDAPIPMYIYNLNKLNVVAFLQENGTKTVKQAAMSTQITTSADANLDAGISSVSGFSTVQFCNSTITPVVVVKNNNTTVLTSATINWTVDNGLTQTQAWTGSLAQNATQNVTLPALTLSEGQHSIFIWLSQPNNSVELYPNNNYQAKNIMVVVTPIAAPITQGFQVTSFPPANWNVEDNENDGIGWMLSSTAGGFGASSKCAKLNFYDSPTGNIDNLYTPYLSLTGFTHLYLNFSVSHRQYRTSSDRLKVEVSSNCGGTWTSVYDKQGSTLATGTATDTSFTPRPYQWRAEEIDLSSYATSPNLIVRFSGISNYGNNVYLDDVNLSATSHTGINENLASGKISIYPNPFNESATLNVDLVDNAQVRYEIYNVLGEKVYSEPEATYAAGLHLFTIEGKGLNTGLYFVKIQINKETVTQKITITR